LPQRLGALASLAGKFRPIVKARIENAGRRRRFWESFFDGEIASDILAGREDVASKAIDRHMNAAIAGLAVQDEAPGEVVLVGAGPGDPGLLTLRALRALQNADVILYDRLVSDEVLDLAR